MATKRLQLVVAFQSTAEAMAFEDCAREEALPGRLIPTPTQIAEGCGLAWKTECSERENVERLLVTRGLSYDRLAELELSSS